ncbi:WD repeat-containing protein on Y chromosome-like [Channa argus]
MKEIYGSVDEKALTALHMMVDTNCKNTISLGELMDFQLKKNQLSESLNIKEKLFPQGMKIIPSNHHRSIIGMVFRPFKGPTNREYDSEENVRIYQKGQYISVSSDGLLTFWTDVFDKQLSILLSKQESTGLYSEVKKMHVNDMVYIKELKQVAICTTERELTFYHCSEDIEQFAISYFLIVETNIVSAMNYCSTGTKGMFSYGDMKGFLYVFVSNNIQTNGLFCQQAYEKIALKKYSTVYVSALLKNPSKDFICVKVSIFKEECSLIRYFPSLDLFAVCGCSSKAMVLSDFSKTRGRITPNRVFTVAGNQEVFTCVEYSPLVGQLVTGGVDGLLRVWFPHKNISCEEVLKGHARPITHILYNQNESVFLSLSDDMNVRVWSEHSWLCVQSFQAHGMEHTRISSVCYNIYNNELVLANTDIGKCLGRGTDVFKNTITSHDKPLCSALYHSTFEQVVSVCQNGVVSVWDILTGRIVMQFNVTPEQRVGITAMSFDEAKRRLITVSDDGKVRLWNFNNATELAALPVTVPKEVTAIVCVKNRIFVSSRKSNIIYDLDIEKNDHRFLTHNYLKDIISMDASGTLLITASSNGNIVAWNADTGEDLYWCNGRISPQTQMAARTDHRQSIAKCRDKHRILQCKQPVALTDIKAWVKKIPLIICLKTREENMNIATLLTFAGGYINAWSVNSKGGIIAKFRAVPERQKGSIITTVSTDASESILLTGDNTGRICLWNIKEFGFKKQEDTGPFVDIDGWHVSLCPPPLLQSWQAHHSWVVSVTCDPSCKSIITAGLDCTVQLWTKEGYCIGRFGRDEWEATQACPERTAVQEEVEKPHTAEGKTIESPLSSPSPPPIPVPDFSDLYKTIDKMCLPTGDALLAELGKMQRRLPKWIKEMKDAIEVLDRPDLVIEDIDTQTLYKDLL